MKKCVILKVISILFALMTLLAISCAITGTGSGFLDLSNIARAVCIGIAVICGILAVITWKYAESTVFATCKGVPSVLKQQNRNEEHRGRGCPGAFLRREEF